MTQPNEPAPTGSATLDDSQAPGDPVRPILPLVHIRGANFTLTGWGPAAHSGPDYPATCRVCGPLPSPATPQSLRQAVQVQQAHLAEHLDAIAAEKKRATRTLDNPYLP